MMTADMRRILIFGFAVMAASAYAFEPAEGSSMKPVPAQSQEKLAAQQAYNGVAPVVGSVELAPRKAAGPPKSTPQTKNASPAKPEPRSEMGQSVMEGESAAKLLRKVELDNQMAASAPFRNLIWAVVVVGIGLGLAFLVKFFADKSMPQVPTKSRVRW